MSLVLLACFALPLAASDIDIPLRNWSVPSLSSSGGGRFVARTDAETNTSGAIFYGLEPCRILDTRNAAGPFGGPIFGFNETRSYDLDSGSNPCPGIPTAAAYSLNFTIIGYSGDGFLTAWPAGDPRPIVSTLNFGAGTIIANAAVVPANGGAISVFAFNPTHIIIDINGYYMDNHVSNPGTNFRIIVDEDASFGAIFANNINNTAVTSAVYGYLQSNTQTGSAAVKGEANAVTGQTIGVAGYNNSTTAQATGVYGRVGNPTGFTNTNVSAGVLGRNAGGGGVVAGVWGQATERGVTGYQCNPTCGAGGVVGVSATVGLHSYGDITAAGTKSFVTPHPSDISKQIVYIALEGGEAGTYFRGRGRFVNGRATIEVPEDFRLVTEEQGLTVQITPIGRMAQVGVVHSDLNLIEVEGSRDVEFSYLVMGARVGFTDRKPIQENSIFVPSSPDEQMEMWPTHIRSKLIELGVYNADGSVNMVTAERMGWTKVWQQKAARAGK